MAEAEAAGGWQTGEGGAEGGFTASSPLPRFILQLTAQQLVDKADVEVAEAPSLSLPPGQSQGVGRECRSPHPGLQESRLLLSDC